MTLPIILQPFACDGDGVKKPIEPDLYAVEFKPDDSFLVDAMPLVQVTSQEPNALENTIVYYEGQNVNFQRGIITDRDRSTPPGSVWFTEYLLTDTSTAPVPVYPLTSGYLHYLHSEKSDPNLLGGAKPRTNEEILILRPLPTNWYKSHPGSKPLLVECAYLNVALDENKLKILIERSTTQAYHKKIYKEKTGAEVQDTPTWTTEYLNLFKQYPDVPIVVSGWESIALTKANSTSDSTQRITMFFAMSGDPPKWTGHDDEVEAFFNYYQRRNGLGGHPLIAKLLGHSVRSGTVDVIPRSTSPFGLRSKDKPIADFANLATSSNPAYHPLALDPDQHPHRLIVPKPPDTGTFPILNLTLRDDHWLTRLKVSNPLRLDLTIDRGSVSAEVSIDPLSFDVAEQVIEVKVIGPLPPPSQPGEPTEATMKLTTSDGTLVHDIKLTFLDFHTVAVKFYKLNDTNPNHQTDMDEPKLREVIAYANEILGRQANVYIYPIEGPDPVTGNNTILHKLSYPEDLGDPIKDPGKEALYEFFPGSSPPENLAKNLNVIILWNQESAQTIGGRGVAAGLTYGNIEVGYAFVLLDTKKSSGLPFDIPALAIGLLHEMGHWFNSIFIRWPNERAGLPACSGSDKHFSHPPNECEGGDWSFYDNLMGVSGGRLITFDQAKEFNNHANEVLA